MTAPADEPVGCAVVGLGHMGKAHVAMLRSLRDARLIACMDVDSQRAADCPPGVRFTTNLDEALDTEGLEAVIVATPPDKHRLVVEAAAARDLAILCEKPLAGSLEDGDALVGAGEAGARVFVGHVLRFDAGYRAVQGELASGALGQLISITGWLNSDLSEQAYYAPRSTLAREMAVHHLDLFRWIGGEIGRISGVASRWHDLEAGLVANVQFRGGAVGSLQVSWARPEGYDNGMSVIATAGLRRVEASVPDSLRSEVTTFLDCARGAAGWPLDLADARAALALSLALEKAVTTGTVVELPDAGVGRPA